jgi:hypothetical protein
MKLFNIDLHISVIADIKDIFKRTHPSIEIVDWSLSGHTWVMGKEPNQVDIINQYTWKHLNMDMIREFQEKYHTFLSSFDGFIVCHPNCFTLLFEKYNKPVLVINSCRYDIPFCWTKNRGMILELNACLNRLNEKKLLTFVSNNMADNHYFRLCNNINTVIIPSLCLYTDMKWVSNPLQKTFLLYTGQLPVHPLITKRSSLPPGYSWQELMNFKGIIHIPYEASTMSIFEHISSGIPLFFPTQRCLKELWSSGQDKGMNYWIDPPPPLESTRNDEFWIRRADYYRIEGAYYFDSIDELFSLLVEFIDTKYDIRKNFIGERNNSVLNAYRQIGLNFS